MDDILIAAPSFEILAETYVYLKEAVSHAGLVIAPGKVQQSEPWIYLEHVLFHWTIWLQTLQINPPESQPLITSSNYWVLLTGFDLA